MRRVKNNNALICSFLMPGYNQDPMLPQLDFIQRNML